MALAKVTFPKNVAAVQKSCLPLPSTPRKNTQINKTTGRNFEERGKTELSVAVDYHRSSLITSLTIRIVL